MLDDETTLWCLYTSLAPAIHGRGRCINRGARWTPAAVAAGPHGHTRVSWRRAIIPDGAADGCGHPCGVPRTLAVWAAPFPNGVQEV